MGGPAAGAADEAGVAHQAADLVRISLAGHDAAQVVTFAAVLSAPTVAGAWCVHGPSWFV